MDFRVIIPSWRYLLRYDILYFLYIEQTCSMSWSRVHQNETMDDIRISTNRIMVLVWRYPLLTEISWNNIQVWTGITKDICIKLWGAINRWSSYAKLWWWRHQMETFSASLALCAGNSAITGEIPSQRPVMWSFGVFFELCLNKRLSKQSRRRRLIWDVIVLIMMSL